MADLSRVVWLGGAQWTGKTTITQLMSVRHGMIPYAYDYHDARAHHERARLEPDRFPLMHAARHAAPKPDGWVASTVDEMVSGSLDSFAERFGMVLDDLADLPDAPVLAEGWGLRPQYVAPLISSPRQALFLIPTAEWIQYQLAHLPRAITFGDPVSDADQAARKRTERNRLIAEDAAASAQQLGLRVVHVDGSLGIDAMLALVEEHFRPHLPRWRY